MKKFILPVLLILLSITSLIIGNSDIALRDLLTWSLTETQMKVLWVSRIPRLISLLIAGAGLSIAGLIMQQLTRNKFVSPTTAGTMDSARLGILVSMLLFNSANMLVKVSLAFACALIGTFVFMKILDKIKFKDVIFVPLVGIMFGGIVGAITTFFAYKHDLIQSMNAWLYGDFSNIIKGQYEMLYVSIPAIIVAFLYANRFTVAGMGEDFSTNLGLNYKQVVNIGLIIVALVTSVIVLTAGMLPFIGLIIPNIVSIYRGDNLKSSLPITAMAGAIFILLCDIFGRLIIYPYEMPIGITVVVIGSSIFLYLLLRRRAQ